MCRKCTQMCIRDRFRHVVEDARFFAAVKTGNKIAAKIAIIAITTNSSISVKPCLFITNPPPSIYINLIYPNHKVGAHCRWRLHESFQ